MERETRRLLIRNAILAQADEIMPDEQHPKALATALSHVAIDAIDPAYPEFLTTLEGDGPCAECGTEENVVWFTDNTFWNAVVRLPNDYEGARDEYRYAIERWGREPILCIRCFVAVAEERGFRPTGWRLLPEWPTRRS